MPTSLPMKKQNKCNHEKTIVILFLNLLYDKTEFDIPQNLAHTVPTMYCKTLILPC